MSQQKLAFIINKEFHYITVIQLTNQGFQCIAVFLYYLKTEKDGPCQLFMLSSHGFYYKDGRQCIFWNLPKACFILSATVFKFLCNSITVFSLSDLLRFDQLRFCIRQCYASVCIHIISRKDFINIIHSSLSTIVRATDDIGNIVCIMQFG